jgi:hypothetical protein
VASRVWLPFIINCHAAVNPVSCFSLTPGVERSAGPDSQKFNDEGAGFGQEKREERRKWRYGVTDAISFLKKRS